jgi:radical SAM protein with 4Fe4S-binding SPASM domain
LVRKLAITSELNITPCHIAIDEVQGNVKDVGISKILRSGKMDFFWKLSKEKIKTCNRCEYRFLCFNNPILEHCRENKKFSENKYCKYNPVTGKTDIS